MIVQMAKAAAQDRIRRMVFPSFFQNAACIAANVRHPVESANISQVGYLPERVGKSGRTPETHTGSVYREFSATVVFQ
jgi:hypothetical protein